MRQTYRNKYNQNHGYIASRRILQGKYKGNIIVLYDNRDGIQCGSDAGKYVIVNETLSLIGSSYTSRAKGFKELKGLAKGNQYEW